MTDERFAEIVEHIEQEYQISRCSTLNECIDFFRFERLHWCGCGDSDIALKSVKDYLSLTYHKMTQYDELHNNPPLLCLAYTLDAAGLTEHGGSIYAAWPTPEGEMFLDLLEAKFDEEDNSE